MLRSLSLYEKYGKYDIKSKTLKRVFRRNSQRLYIKIPHLKSNLQILRIFGSLISQIRCDWNMCPIHLTDYLNNFCSETLSDIELYIFSKNALDSFKNPFTMVKTVRINLKCSVLNLVHMNSLVQLFPKMRELLLSDHGFLTFTYNGFIVNHFPYLEYMEIKNSILGRYRYSRHNGYIEVFKTFLRLNPQLKHLCLSNVDRTELEVLKFLSESEHSLERLELYEINIKNRDFFNNTNGEKIHLRNLKYLFMECIYPGQIRYGNPFLCDQLEKFEVKFDCSLREWFYEFVQNNSSIRKLKIALTHDHPDFSRLVQYLPLLEEISLNWSILSFDEVFYIITLFKSLKYCYFFAHTNFEYKQLEARLNYGWSIRIVPEFDHYRFKAFILERKI